MYISLCLCLFGVIVLCSLEVIVLLWLLCKVKRMCCGLDFSHALAETSVLAMITVRVILL